MRDHLALTAGPVAKKGPVTNVMRVCRDFLSRHRYGLVQGAIVVGAMLVAPDAMAQTPTNSISAWFLQAVQNMFNSVPSLVSYFGVVGGGTGVGIGVYKLYHHIDDGGRMSEKTGTVVGTGFAAALMALPLLMNLGQTGATTAGGTSTIAKQTVTIQ